MADVHLSGFRVIGVVFLSALLLPACLLGQRLATNTPPYPEAIKLISQIPAGTQQSDVRKFLERNGFGKRGHAIGGAIITHAGWFHQQDELAGGHALELSYEPTISRTTNIEMQISTSRLRSACVRSNGVLVISIPLSNSPPSAVGPSARNLDSFSFDWPNTTVQDVIAKFGAPDRDVGSGINILEYRLQDGSRLWIGSPNNSRIIYVRHGSASVDKGEVLYERR